MSQSNHCRRLSVAPLAGVERRGRGSLGSGSLAVGISNSLPSGSRFIQGTHPFSGILSQFDQGQSSGGRGPVFTGQGGCKSPEREEEQAAPLPSPGFYSRLFVVMKASGAWRPVIDLSPESEGTADILQDGDSPIRASVSTPGGLDGVSGLEGCVLAGSDASGISQVPQVHGGREGVGLPVQGSLLWTLHRSAGFHQGHGSCVRYSSQDRGAASPLPGRLVNSGLLSRVGSPCSEDSAPALQFVRNSRQLGEVLGDSGSTDGLSGSHSGLNLFQGFSCPEESREASLNWRRILVLRKAASIILAGAIRSTVFNDTARSGRPTSNEVSSACSAEALGSCRSIDSGRVVSRDSPGSRLVARSRTVGARHFSGAGVPSARIVVRGLGHGLGGSSRRSCYFWPLGSRGGRIIDQCQRAPGHRESSPVVCSSTHRFFGCNFRPQLHGHCLPQEPGRHAFSSSELHRAEDSPLGGVSSSCGLPTVHHGEAQRASGCFISPEPDSGLRMNTETGGLSGSVQEVAGLDRPFCHISKSPMFDIFFTLPRSERSGNGCASSELEWVAGVCLSSLVSNSSSSEEAPVVLWGPSHHHSTLVASEALVSGSSGSGGDGPVALPQSRDLLRQPHFHQFHLGVSRLSLHAWRLSSDLPEPGDSPSV